ncbi:MAG: site-2 protease family protein [Cytophagales bacterium]
MNKLKKPFLLNILLFVLTFATTTIAGYSWIYGEVTFSKDKLVKALPYSISFLSILTAHEFGHYFVARFYKIKTSLPYFIPMFLGELGPSIGTMGAFIRLKSRTKNKNQMFDVGIAGPLIGFLVALIVLAIGLSQLSSAKDFLFSLHEEYQPLGDGFEEKAYTYQFMRQADSLSFQKYLAKTNQLDSNKVFIAQEAYLVLKTGNNLLFHLIREHLNFGHWFPNSFELYHYPYLFAAYLALFFTALNLLPIGQLDGGHIMYGIFGRKIHYTVSISSLYGMLFYGGLGIVNPSESTEEIIKSFLLISLFYFWCLNPYYSTFTSSIIGALGIIFAQVILLKIIPNLSGYNFWLVFAFISARILGIKHPPSEVEEPLNKPRIILGIFAILVFVISFTPNVLSFEILTP